MAKNSSESQKTVLRRLYDLGSRFETAAERVIYLLVRRQKSSRRGLISPVLSHHRAYRSVHGGSTA